MIRIILTFWAILLFSINLYSQTIQAEPPFWWLGMKNPKLQLMLRATDIQKYAIEIDQKGVKIDFIHFVDNKNVVFIDLVFDETMKPCTFPIILKSNGKEVSRTNYEIRARRDGSAERKGYTPADIIYLLLPDRFANGNPKNDSNPNMSEKANRSNPDGRHGGDIEGIRKNLSYFNNLGVTALWINPLLENNMPAYSYHGYAITDFYKVDNRFGTNDDYANLVQEAHKKNLKIIQDMVFNHFGSFHLWHENPPTKEWYHSWPEYTQSNYRSETLMDPYASPSDQKRMSEGWFDKTMPDLNQKNAFVANYLVQNSIWWIEFADLDGIRMDTYPYSDQAFMYQWLKAVELEYPNFLILGEVWLQTVSQTSSFQNTSLDQNHKMIGDVQSLTDFPLMYAVQEALNEKDGWTEGMSRIYMTLSKDFLYFKPWQNVIFLDNHDVTRITSVFQKDFEKWKMAMGILLTTRGVPLIYYGTEIMMEGDKSKGDAALREDFPGGWHGDSVNVFNGQNLNKIQSEAMEYTKKLIEIRQSSDALKNGNLTHYIPSKGIYVYFRYTDSEKIMIIVNNNDKDMNVSMNRYKEQFENYQIGISMIDKNEYPLNKEISIKAKSIQIIKLK
jgi:neopullulanase